MANVNSGIDLVAVNKKIAAGGIATRSELGALLKGNFQDEIRDVLPVHLKENAVRYGRQLMSLFSANPELQTCSTTSLLCGLMTALELGLDLATTLGQCYLIPFKVSKKVNNQWVKTTEAQFQLGYRGMVALARRSGQIINIGAHSVHEKDKFSYRYGINPTIEHVPFEDEDNSGLIKYFYGYATFINQGFDFKVWTYKHMYDHAVKFSQTFIEKKWDPIKREMVLVYNPDGTPKENTKSPWHTHFEAMAHKTMLRAIWKTLPFSTEMMRAITADGAIRKNISNLQYGESILDVEAEPVNEPGVDMAEMAENGVDFGAIFSENDMEGVQGALDGVPNGPEQILQ